MTQSAADINQATQEVERLMSEADDLPPALKAAINMLIVIVKLLASQMGLNSTNSSQPPASDPNRHKTPRKTSSRNPGGQAGRKGKTLTLFDNPDQVQALTIDRRTLPKGDYKDGGFERRQVVDIDIQRVVTEYQAQVLIDSNNRRFVAEFPSHITQSIQYGPQIKAHAVYLSQYQMLPYQRLEEYFLDQLGIPISAGSIANFNQKAAELIHKSGIDTFIRSQLQRATLLHVDETGINIGGRRQWLHCTSNTQWTYFMPHAKRGTEAMNAMSVLPHFTGVLCHDHWKPYYQYQTCDHSLCNAHHLRELQRVIDHDKHTWACDMQTLLLTLNDEVNEAGGLLSVKQQGYYRKRYRSILKQGDSECPPPDDSTRIKGQRGRLKRTKSRCLLERLRHFEHDVLRFMTIDYVPFTNNQGENDIRMAKVQQKISGCFRSMEGAKASCDIRSYISSCRKQGVCATHALLMLFHGQRLEVFNKCAE